MDEPSGGSQLAEPPSPARLVGVPAGVHSRARPLRAVSAGRGRQVAATASLNQRSPYEQPETPHRQPQEPHGV